MLNKFSITLAISSAILVIGGSRAYTFSLPRYVEDGVVVIEDAVLLGGKTEFLVHGTGFLLQDTSKHLTLIITNRHIIQDRDSIFVRFNTRDGTSTRKRAQLKSDDGSRLWVAHPDPDYDVAAIIAPPDLDIRILLSDRLKYTSDLNLGDEVYFIGFPLFELAGRDKNYPIIRGGVVSYIAENDVMSIQNPDSLILPKGMILIDGTSLPGNSGSPVLSVPATGSSKASIIGIIQGHFSNPKTSENLDLGIVVPADEITRLIDYFYEVIIPPRK